MKPSKTNCKFFIQPPPPPTPVLRDNITVEDTVYDPVIRRLMLTITWVPPIYLNGNLSLYQLCLGQEAAVGDRENCSSPSRQLCLRAPTAVSTDSTCQALKLSSSGLPLRTVQYTLDATNTEVMIQVITKSYVHIYI